MQNIKRQDLSRIAYNEADHYCPTEDKGTVNYAKLQANFLISRSGLS